MKNITEEDRNGQDFGFSFSDSLLAEVGEVPQSSLHLDIEAICKAYEAIKPLAERLGVAPPIPRIAEFCYTHLAALGCEVVYSARAEPTVRPLIHSLEEIDELKEPKDYLQAEVIQQRIRICEELRKRYPESPGFIGHLLEGPATTAALIMGPSFFTLPYDDPGRAHMLLEFSTHSALNYAHAISKYFGSPIQPGPGGFPDDFGGIFPPSIFEESVVPYWEKTFQGLEATTRSLHSELLRVEHLPFLEQLEVDYFDPSADQYLTLQTLHEHCPCKFSCTILASHAHNLSEQQLEELYKEMARYRPSSISFSLESLAEEPKIKHLLQVARAMKNE